MGWGRGMGGTFMSITADDSTDMFWKPAWRDTTCTSERRCNSVVNMVVIITRIHHTFQLLSLTTRNASATKAVKQSEHIIDMNLFA